MTEKCNSLILPQGHALEANSDSHSAWMGQFDDGSICEVISVPSHDQNYVELISPSGPVEPPHERYPLTVRGLLMSIQIAAIRSRPVSESQDD